MIRRLFSVRRTDEAAGRPLDRSDEDRGFVLTWFALFLIVLMAMAGFSVDVWNWWYTAQKSQNAADAAALGGVVELPDGSAADTTAKAIAQQNGFSSSQVTTTVGPNNNTLEVDVSSTVDNFFTSLLGIKTTDIARDATAEFVGEVPMGSPENFIGNDPDEGENPDHWLSVSGRGSTKQGGDRYQSRSCSQAAYECPNPGANTEYDPDGYYFQINTVDAATGPLNIEIFDASHAAEPNQNCNNNQNNRLQLPGGYPDYATFYADLDTARGAPAGDSASRYATGENDYCVGDTGGADNMVTTYILREPDASPDNGDNNPVYASGTCTRQYGAIDENNGWLQILLDVANTTDTDAEHVEFADTYRKWTTICTVPAATVNAFRTQYGADTAFILQVRTNSADGDPINDIDYNTGGRNHFSIRAGYGSSLSGDVRVFANGRLPMHAASTGATTEFFLARVTPSQAGRFLEIEFFDTGDAAATGTITILPPAESSSTFTNCTFTLTGGGTPTSSGCQLQNVNSSTGYQGQVATARVNIPTTYNCDNTIATGCWVKVRFSYPASGGAVFDHTVWSAGIVGDPVRLTE